MTTENVAKTSSNSKSPLGFFDRDFDVKNWLEKDNSTINRPLAEASKMLNSPAHLLRANELTSFWVDSNQTQETVNGDVDVAYVETNDDENVDDIDDAATESLKHAAATTSSTVTAAQSNNAEILQQIRKIMGDLELSDEDDDDRNNDDDDDNADETVEANETRQLSILRRNGAGINRLASSNESFYISN